MKPFSMLFTIILTCSFLQLYSQDETPLKAQIVVHNNLAVTSQPTGITVKLDGRETGKTPWTSYKLDPGEYTIEVSHPAYIPQKTTVSVPYAGPVIHFKLNPRPGACIIQTTPSSASVFRGAQLLGLTPLAIPPGQLPFAKQKLRILKYGFEPVELEADISRDKPFAIQINLAPNTGSLTVSVTPAAAQLFMNSVNMGAFTPIASYTRRGKPVTFKGLLPGIHTLVLQYGGQPSIPNKIKITPNQNLSVELRFWYPNYWVELTDGKKLALMTVEKTKDGNLLFLNDQQQFLTIPPDKIKKQYPIPESEAAYIVQKHRIRKKMFLSP